MNLRHLLWLLLSGGLSLAVSAATTAPDDQKAAARETRAGKATAGEAQTLVDPATPKEAQPAGPKGPWTLTFSDEFNDGTLNRAKWTNVTSPKNRPNGNHGVQWGWDARNVSVAAKEGRLAIATTKVGENEYHSGCIKSQGVFEQQYGFFEASIQLPPKGNGHQAAFWLQSATQMKAGGTGAEIDVVESHLASDAGTSTLHWNGYQKGEHQSKSKTWKKRGLHDGFHTYGVEWTPAMLRVYVDGTLVWTYEGQGIPQSKEYIMCSVGILHWVQGDIRNANLPQCTYVDWVRAFVKERP